MPDYGFSVNMSGDVLAAMKRVEKGLESLAQTTTSEVKKVEGELRGLDESLKKIGETLIAAFAVERIKDFTMELLHLTAEFEGFENVIKYASKNGYDASQNLDYIAGAVNRLHLPIKQAMESFSEMEAGFYGTGIEGERLRKVFEGVSTAATVLHLSAFQFGNVTFALKEIGELGTLQARQMRMLAFAMPGAMNIAAKAMHMNTVQFHEAMHHGAINSGEFLPKFAAALQQHFQGGLGNAGNSLISQMNDTETAFVRMKLQLGENLRPMFVQIMQDIRAAFNSDIVKSFVENIRPLVGVAATLVKFWIEYRIALVAVAAATKAYAAAVFIAEAAQMTMMFGAEGLEVALAGISGALITTGIGAFAVAVGFLVEKFIDANKQMQEFVEKATNITELGNQFKDIKGSYGKIETALHGNLSKEEKGEVLGDIQGQIKKTQSLLDKSLRPQIAIAQAAFNKAPRDEFGNINDPASIKIFEGLKSLQFQERDYNRQLINLGHQQKELLKQGIKLPRYSATAGGEALKDSSLHTMGLAGAKGGLGEAKTITNHFHDALQKVSVGTPAGIKAAGQDAIEVILRALNNLSYAQSKTM